MTPNWEGAHNPETHRTTGGRAWCKCGEWCYDDEWCACCHETAGHERYDPTEFQLVPVGRLAQSALERVIEKAILGNPGKEPKAAAAAVIQSINKEA